MKNKKLTEHIESMEAAGWAVRILQPAWWTHPSNSQYRAEGESYISNWIVVFEREP